MLPDPCRGPSFLVSARKEAKKPTGEALNVVLPHAKAALPWPFPARTWELPSVVSDYLKAFTIYFFANLKKK